MKRIFNILLIMSLVFSIMISVSAQQVLEEERQEDDYLKIKEITLEIDSPWMSIDGVSQLIDEQQTVPVIIDGYTYVPLRAVGESLDAKVEWDTINQQAIVTKQYQSRMFRVNNSIEVSPILVNDRVLVPIRLIAESFGADVDWDPIDKVITITEEKLYVMLNGKYVSIGDSVEQIEETFGKPDRVDSSQFGFEWYVYNQDYSEFIMIGIEEGKVVAVYTNAGGFESYGFNYGDQEVSKAHRYSQAYYDEHEEHIYAVLLYPYTRGGETSPEAIRAQELQIFDMTNAFRLNHGKQILQLDTIAEKTAREHSQDLADNNYFDHTDLNGGQPVDRYKRNNGESTYIGENLAAGNLYAGDTFNQWVNSKGHRNNMLRSEYTHLGVGIGVNKQSKYVYYSTQVLTRIR